MVGIRSQIPFFAAERGRYYTSLGAGNGDQSKESGWAAAEMKVGEGDPLMQ